MRRALSLVLVQEPACPGNDLGRFAAEVEQRSRDAPDAQLFVYPELHRR